MTRSAKIVTKVRSDERGVFVVIADWAEPFEGVREPNEYAPTGAPTGIEADEDAFVEAAGPFTERGPRRIRIRAFGFGRRPEIWSER